MSAGDKMLRSAASAATLFAFAYFVADQSGYMALWASLPGAAVIYCIWDCRP